MKLANPVSLALLFVLAVRIWFFALLIVLDRLSATLGHNFCSFKKTFPAEMVNKLIRMAARFEWTVGTELRASCKCMQPSRLPGDHRRAVGRLAYKNSS